MIAFVTAETRNGWRVRSIDDARPPRKVADGAAGDLVADGSKAPSGKSCHSKKINGRSRIPWHGRLTRQKGMHRQDITTPGFPASQTLPEMARAAVAEALGGGLACGVGPAVEPGDDRRHRRAGPGIPHQVTNRR